MATPYEFTKDGFEVQFQSNYLGHFTFTYPLIPLLVETSKDPTTSVRIIQVSSGGHNFATGIKDGVHFDSIDIYLMELRHARTYPREWSVALSCA